MPPGSMASIDPYIRPIIPQTGGHVKMKTYPFSALCCRMKYITRWCLMRSTRPESLSEHTADTAMLAHTLCLIGRHCTGTGAALRPEVVATAAIYHDAPEILTGDMPTPVKYKNDALRTAYKAVEHESARVMASLQPEELQAETQVWLLSLIHISEPTRLGMIS